MRVGYFVFWFVDFGFSISGFADFGGGFDCLLFNRFVGVVTAFVVLVYFVVKRGSVGTEVYCFGVFRYHELLILEI